MKKFLYFLIALTLSFQFNAFAASEGINEDFPTSDFVMLKNLGIFDNAGISESGDYITRAQFSVCVYNLFGFESCGINASEQFIDVGEGYFAARPISTLYELHLVSGVSAEFFAPESPVSLADAVKIIVSALGYGIYAEQVSGYPNGYFNTAKRLDIISSDLQNGNIDSALLTEILKSTLEVSPLDGKSFSDGSSVYTSDKTESIGERIFGLNKTQGVVTEITLASEYGKTGKFGDRITVGGNEYAVKDIDIFNWIGHYAEIWYTKTKSDSCATVVGISDAAGSRVLRFEAGDISDFANREYTYYEGSKSRRAIIDTGAEIYYNGRAVPFFEELMVPRHGDVTLIDYKGSSEYDAVIVTSYQNGFVSSLDKNGNVINLEEELYYYAVENGRLEEKSLISIDFGSGRNYCRIYNKNGSEKSIFSIKENCIVSVFHDPADEGMRIQYSINSINGTVDEIDSSNKTVTVDQKQYDIFWELISETDIRPGTSGKFYLDYKDNIVYTDKDKKELTSALFVRTVYTNGLSGKPYIVFVNTDTQKTETLELKSSVKVDGVRYSVKDEASLYNMVNSFREYFRTSENSMYTSLEPIRYKTNNLGQVTEIHTVNSPFYTDVRHINTYEDGISTAVSHTTLNTIGDKVLFDANTVFIDVPYALPENDSFLEYAECFVCFRNKYMLRSNTAIGSYYDIYYLDDTDVASIIIKHGKLLTEPAADEEYSEYYMPPAVYTELAMMIGTGTSLAEDGEEYETMYMLNADGTEMKYNISPKYSSKSSAGGSVTATELEEGDIFAYYVKDNYIGNFCKVYDRSFELPMSAFLGAPRSYDSESGTNVDIDAKTATSGKYNSTYRVSVGTVYAVRDGILTVALGDTTDNSNLAYYNINPDRILVCDASYPGGRKIYKGTITDIKDIRHFGSDASKAAIYIKSARTVTVFLYNE